MSESIMDRIKRLKDSRPQNKQWDRLKDIYHRFHDGDNNMRLVGDFFEVRTHYIAPDVKRGSRGLCASESFRGEVKLPNVINCYDWDVTTEQPTAIKTCPICRLHRLAKNVLKGSDIDDADEKFFKALEAAVRASFALKWNILDRDNPYIIKMDGDKEVKVKGYKVASISREAFTDIEVIFSQVQQNIADIDNGMDIVVTKSNGTRVSYSARVAMNGITAKVTPLTAEERALEMHDLKRLCGKYSDMNLLMNSLHGDLRDILDANPETPQVATPAPKAAPATAPVTKAAPVAAPTAAPKAAAAPAVARVVAPPPPAPAAVDDSDPLADEDAVTEEEAVPTPSRAAGILAQKKRT